MCPSGPPREQSSALQRLPLARWLPQVLWSVVWQARWLASALQRRLSAGLAPAQTSAERGPV